MFKDKSFLSVFVVFATAIFMLLASLVLGSIGFGKDLAFYFLSIVMVASAIGVVTVPNLMHSGFLLVLTFVSTAGIYALINADFLAAAQILINGGAVTIMMMFAVMLTNSEKDSSKTPYSLEYRFTAFVLSAFGLFLILILRIVGVNMNLWGIMSGKFLSFAPSVWSIKEPVSISTTPQIGLMFFDKYLVPFEVASVLLLMSLIGAIVLALKEVDVKENLIESSVADLEKNDSEKASVAK